MTRRKALVAATAIGLLGSIAVAAPASAHNYLVSTTPAADSTVTEQPGTLVLTTNDDLLVLGTDGTAAALRVVGPEASMPLELGAAGEYEVTWQVVSPDGHPVSGQYAFDWAPADGTALADGSDSVPDCNGTVAVSGGPAESADEAQATSGSDPALLGDVLWIGGALAAVAAAIGVTLLVLRRRPRD